MDKIEEEIIDASILQHALAVSLNPKPKLIGACTTAKNSDEYSPAEFQLRNDI